MGIGFVNNSEARVGSAYGVCATCRYWGGARRLDSEMVVCALDQDEGCYGPCMRLGSAYSRNYSDRCIDYVQWSDGTGFQTWNDSDKEDADAIRRETEAKVRSEVEAQLRAEMDEKLRKIKDKEHEREIRSRLQEIRQRSGTTDYDDIRLSDFTMPMPNSGYGRAMSSCPPSCGVAEPRMDPLFKKMVWGMGILVFVAYFISMCRG